MGMNFGSVELACILWTATTKWLQVSVGSGNQPAYVGAKQTNRRLIMC